MIESIDDLIVFLKHFHRNVLADPSLPPDRIPDGLPEGLAKIYRELGGLIDLKQHPSPFNAQDTLILAEPHDGRIVFCFENQGCWSAYCQANEKDPPVYAGDPDEGEFVVVCESLNHFLITFCLQEACFSSHNFAFANNANILEVIKGKEKFQPLWLNGQYVDNRYGLSNFYISEDRDILIIGNYWIGSQTRPLVEIFDPNADPNIKVNMFRVDLPRRYWTQYSEWKAEWLLDEDNASIRRVLIEQLGYEKICDRLGAVSIDSWREYTLIKLDNMQIIYDRGIEVGREPMMFLKMTCPSTADIHILRVPPDLNSAEAAITWINHGIHPDKFATQT